MRRRELAGRPEQGLKTFQLAEYSFDGKDNVGLVEMVKRIADGQEMNDCASNSVGR